MTADDLEKIELALWTRPAQQSLTRREMRSIYFHVLKDMDSQTVPALLEWILLSKDTFRPTPGQIHAYAQRLGGNTPIDGRRVITEIRRHIAANGANCVPVPGRPACFLPGPPPNLTPQARAFVAARGGWQSLCLADIGSEEIYWHEAAREAAELCETLKIETVRQRLVASSSPHRITSSPAQIEAAR